MGKNKTKNAVRILCPICQAGLLQINIWTIKERTVPLRVQKNKIQLDWVNKIEESGTEEATLICQNPKCGDSISYDSVEKALRDATALLSPAFLVIQKPNGELLPRRQTDLSETTENITVKQAAKPVAKPVQAPKILISKEIMSVLCPTT